MFWFDTDALDRDRLYHSCYRGERQLCPTQEDIEKFRYYEDGYFRGIIKGRFSHMFRGSPYPHNVIRCKGCGEEFRW